MSSDEIDRLLRGIEGEHLEFKEARTTYQFEDLAKYCVALANEGGGKVVLGVTDQRPRQVVGSQAFAQPERTRAGLIERLHLGVTVREIQDPRGRVLIFEVPSRPIGTAIQYEGVRWMRRGDALVPMSDDRLRQIFAESAHDFSADVCPGATMADLSEAAIEDFRRRWITKSRNEALARLDAGQLLRDAELATPAGLTYAALILFGTRMALRRLLPPAEVVFEYRSSQATGPAQDRKEYAEGFFGFHDALWETINLRNDKQHYQEGLFVLDISTFDERSVREAILNAVCHRDYQLGGSIFVRQTPRRLIIESPGGLPAGVTTENILDRQSPRNRRLAEALMKCGLVERSGQGMNLMFEQSIRQGKHLPDFTGTDAHQLTLTLEGHVRDVRFVQFLERTAIETGEAFSTHAFLLLDLLHRGAPVPAPLRPLLPQLVDSGVVEVVGRGRGARHTLTRRYYAATGSKGVYTRKRGLDRQTNKELLFKHIRDNASAGSALKELMQVLPALSRSQVQILLRELRDEGRILPRGKTRASLWYPMSAQSTG